MAISRRKRDEVYVQGILNDPPPEGHAHAEIGLSRKCPGSGRKGVSFIDCVEGVLHSHSETRRIISKLGNNKWNAALAGMSYFRKGFMKGGNPK